MTAHGSDNMASRFPESLSEVQISEINEKAIPINKKKVTKFGLGIFQGKVLFLNIILHLNFTREAEIVTLTRNNCQLPSLFTNFKIQHKNKKIKIFYFADSLVWYMLMQLFTSVSVKSSVYSPRRICGSVNILAYSPPLR